MKEHSGNILRMYFFVPYNISPIQQAIQAGHAALEYARFFGDEPEFEEFVSNHKTWIILNGGTTNNTMNDERTNFIGTLNQIKSEIISYNYMHKDGDPSDLILYADFCEPDLNDALTAVCFIADERVWDYENYPHFHDFMVAKMGKIKWLETFKNGPWSLDELKAIYPKDYADWAETLGGEKNVFLRELLRGKKLA